MKQKELLDHTVQSIDESEFGANKNMADNTHW